FLFLLPRRAPTSPLFPYTTLFRSRIRVDLRAEPGLVHPQGVVGDVVEHEVRDDRALRVSDDGEQASRVVGIGVPDDALGLFVTEDRKSTRLNSSHLVISYAVFCLK